MLELHGFPILIQILVPNHLLDLVPVGPRGGELVTSSQGQNHATRFVIPVLSTKSAGVLEVLPFSEKPHVEALKEALAASSAFKDTQGHENGACVPVRVLGQDVPPNDCKGLGSCKVVESLHETRLQSKIRIACQLLEAFYKVPQDFLARIKSSSILKGVVQRLRNFAFSDMEFCRGCVLRCPNLMGHFVEGPQS